MPPISLLLATYTKKQSLTYLVRDCFFAFPDSVSIPVAREVGIEPTTNRLTAGCSAAELLPNTWAYHAVMKPLAGGIMPL
jgi:hypothetical protein